jgi:hypothetical protein
MGTEGTDGKPRFEPPPWELEAFEALAARRAEEQVALDALAAAEATRVAAEAAEAAVPPEDPWDEVPNVVVTPPAEAAEAAEGDGSVQVDGDEPPAQVAKVHEGAVEAMLMQLRSEERTDGSLVLKVGRTAAALTIVLGLAMLIGGMSLVGQAHGKMANVLGSLVLAVIGLSFMGMAVWVWISTGRSRGR